MKIIKLFNRKLIMLPLAAALFFILPGCGQGGDNLAEQGNEPDEVRAGSPPDDETHTNEEDIAVVDSPVYGASDCRNLPWTKKEFEEPSGKWFLHNGEGLLGYQLTTGTQRAGSSFVVDFIAHKDEGEAMARTVRVQLISFNEDGKEEIVKEKEIFVETAGKGGPVYSGYLPEKENVSYVLAVEILNEAGETEDTMLSCIYVPEPEINAELMTDKEVYSGEKELILILENHGPTELFFGVDYAVEKKEADSWVPVPLDLAFISIGLYLPPGEEYESIVDISELPPGEYRVLKNVRVEELDLQEMLTAPFIIE
jgi:hypothetical protein